jgi:hypothetical protein
VTAWLCLACRHPVPDGGGCDQPGHQAVRLDEAGRPHLLTAVWGDPDLRRRHHGARTRRGRRAATAGVGSGVIAGLAMGVTVGPSRPLILVTGLLVGAVAGGFAGMVRRGDDDAGVPHPAAALPEVPPFARGTVIDAGDDGRSPASGVWAAAWAIELTVMRPGGARVVFRNAWCAGLELALDDGARARVPAGPWRPSGGLVPLLDVDELGVLAHLRRIDPQHHDQDELTPFRHDAVHEALISVGDRVELGGAWHPTIDDRDRVVAPLYREAPPSVLVPAGWPVLRRTRGRAS